MNAAHIRRTIGLGTVRMLSSVFPDRFARIGAKRFLEPRTLVRPQRWPQAFERFERRLVTVGDETVPLWIKGEGPRVLLVHGWESDHNAMGAFVEPLLSQGYSVAALDLPAHGLATGRRAPLLLLARAIARAGVECGELHAIIAHSVGGATSVLAMEAYGLQASRLVLIGAPQAARYQALSQGRAQGLSERSLTRMTRHIQQGLEAPLERFRTDLGLAQLDTAVMLVHAEDDAVVPIAAARSNAAACKAKTLWLDSGGHNRVLGEPRVLQAIASFLKTGSRRNRFPGALRRPPGASRSDQLREASSSAPRGGASC